MANKFDPKSLRCVFLGYSAKYKGYRCLYPPTGRVYLSHHVIFDEASFPFQDIYSSHHPPAGTTLRKAWLQGLESSIIQSPVSAEKPNTSVLPLILPVAHSETSSGLHNATPNPTVGTVTSPVPEHPSTSTTSEEPCPGRTPCFDHDAIGDSVFSSDVRTDDSEVQASDSVNQENPVAAGITNHPMVTRSQAGIRKPNPRYALLSHKVSFPRPRTVTDALKHPGWNGAMTDEIDTCGITKTWSLVPYSPEMNVLESKWIFTPKIKSDGELERLKARVVAQGFDQEEGIDYLETYSPVVRSETVREVLHLATVMEWPITQMDVKNAFLHGELTEEVYMKQPAGFVDKAKPDHVCLLHKAIYGLKQAPRA